VLIYIILAFWLLVGVGFIYMMRKFSGSHTTPLQRKKDERGESGTSDKVNKATGQFAHINDLIKIDDVYEGIYKKGETFYSVARLSGTNFDVMTDFEQDARESVLIEILSEIDYPIQAITTTIVSDIDDMVKEILERAEAKPKDHPQYGYGYLLAGSLYDMKMDHKIMSRQSWIVISSRQIDPDDDPVQKINEYMYLLSENMRSKAKIFVTPVRNSEEVLDVLYQVLLPQSIIKPSDRIYAGVNEPFHFRDQEISQARKGDLNAQTA